MAEAEQPNTAINKAFFKALFLLLGFSAQHNSAFLRFFLVLLTFSECLLLSETKLPTPLRSGTRSLEDAAHSMFFHPA